MNASKKEPDLRLVDEALEREGLTVIGGSEERVERLKAHYETRPQHELADCDVCGFGSPAEEPACAFCGHSDAENPAAIVEALPSDLGDVAEAEHRLDQAIARYASAGRDMVGSGWDMGNAAREIRESKLYLARRAPKGEPIYRNFEEFCRLELRRSARDIRQMIDVSENFSREDAIQVGTTKLGITLRVIDAERRAPLLDMARDPAVTVRQLTEATREATKDQAPKIDRLGRAHKKMGRRPKGPIFPPVAPFLPKPAEEPQAEEAPKRVRRLTLAIEEGEHQVLLWARRNSPGDRRRAREVTDGPVGRIRFLNGMQMRIRVFRGEKGMYLKIEATVAADEEEEA